MNSLTTIIECKKSGESILVSFLKDKKEEHPFSTMRKARKKDLTLFEHKLGVPFQSNLNTPTIAKVNVLTK